MEETFPPVESSAPSVEPSALLVLLALLVAALALKVVLTSASEGQRAHGTRASTVALWPGLLAWGMGLWAAGLLALVGLEPVANLRFSGLDAAWLFAAALLSGLPPMLWLTRRPTSVRSLRRLGGTAVLLALPGLAMPAGWLHAARLDPAPLWLLAWCGFGAVVATVGLGAALGLAYNPLGQSQRARRLSRTAAAVAGGVALLLGQVLVHEGALVSDEAFSSASASVPVGMMAGLGALTPMLLVGLMVLQRLRRYAREDRRQQARGTDRRRDQRHRQAGLDRRADTRAGDTLTETSTLGPMPFDTTWPSGLPPQPPPGSAPEAAQPRKRSKHRRHRLL